MCHWALQDKDEESQVQLVKHLVELFEQIDVNGDGSLEWEEFTSFCIEAGMMASQQARAPLTFAVSAGISLSMVDVNNEEPLACSSTSTTPSSTTNTPDAHLLER